jgi:group I intron endonuclease
MADLLESGIVPNFGLIYILKNRVNLKLYVGQTTTTLEKRWRSHLDELSGLESKSAPMKISRAIKKYGKEAFDRFIIATANDQEELNSLEIFYIAFFDTLNDRFGYNTRLGGSKGKFSVETRKKLSESNKNRKYVKTPAMRAYWESRRGVRRHPSIGRRIGDKLRNRQFPERKETASPRMLEKWKDPEYRKMQSASHQKPRTKKYARWNNRFIKINNGTRNRLIEKSLPIPEGWVLGGKPRIVKKGYKISKKLIWITDGIRSSKIEEGTEIPQGWRRGMKKKEGWAKRKVVG